jgi:hypothetical protein
MEPCNENLIGFIKRMSTLKRTTLDQSSLMMVRGILNSRATHHVTADLGNFSIRSDYQGDDQLRVENGKGLRIENIGKTFTLSNPNYGLNDVLHVPEITRNLLSVNSQKITIYALNFILIVVM